MENQIVTEIKKIMFITNKGIEKEESIFKKETRRQKALAIFSNIYVSVSESYERREKKEWLDKLDNLLSSLKP